MNVLLLHAHPEPQSFCAALKDQAVRTLEAEGHDVKVSDLYEMGWDPVSGPDDFLERAEPDYLTYALEQRHATKAKQLAPDIQAELDKLLWADLLILNFPIYWFSVPAILKGWFDRVLVSGLCYGGKRFYDQGPLSGKKALVCCTLGGRDYMFADQGIHGPIKEMLRPVLQGTLGYIGCSVIEPFVAWHVPYVSDDVRTKYLVDYEAYLQGLESAPLMSFPSLNDFDDKMVPLKK